MSFQEFLNYLSGPGVQAVIGFLLSFTTEWWPEYDKLPPRAKRLVFFVACLVIPTIGAALRVAFGYAAPSWEDLFWPALVAGFAAFGTGTLAHARKL